MGITVEFFSAEPHELLKMFSPTEDENFAARLDQAYQTIPMADFSLHLAIPDDLDRLCLAIRKQQRVLPPIFRDVIAEELMSDDICEWLLLLSPHFARAVASLSDEELEVVAREWVVPFAYHEPLHQTPAYQALLQLRSIALDSLQSGKALLYYQLG